MLEYLPKNDERIILGRRENKKEYSVVEIVHYPNINNIFVFVEERESCYLDKIQRWLKTFRDEYAE